MKNFSHSKKRKLASEAAKVMRAIPSEKRRAASSQNLKKAQAVRCFNARLAELENAELDGE
jgi:hypothetical protein